MDEMMGLLKKYGFEPEVTLREGYNGSLKLESFGGDIDFDFDGTSMTIFIGVDGVGASFHGRHPQRHCTFCEEGYPAKNDEHSVFDSGSWKTVRCQK